MLELSARVLTVTVFMKYSDRSGYFFDDTLPWISSLPARLLGGYHIDKYWENRSGNI